MTLRERCVKNTICDNFGKGADPGPTVPSWQAFYKPLPNKGAAIFIVNHADTPQDIHIDFSSVPGLGPPPSLRLWSTAARSLISMLAGTAPRSDSWAQVCV